MSQAISQHQPRLSTGITTLDTALGGGVSRNAVSEVYGCPGSGKTTFGMALAAEAVRCGHRVVWLSCSQPLPVSRLRDFLQPQSLARRDEHQQEHTEDEEEEERGRRQRLESVTCVATPTLTSLLSLLTTYCGVVDNESALFHEDTALLVIDDLTTLYNAAFPPAADVQYHNNNNNNNNSSSGRDASARKIKVLSVVSDHLLRLAATRNIAVLVLAKLTSRIIKGSRAQLESPFGDAWSSRCAARFVLYRNHDDAFTTHYLTNGGGDGVRWIAIQKHGNKSFADPVGLPFEIIGSGMVSVEAHPTSQARSQGTMTPRKWSRPATPDLQPQVKRTRNESYQADEARIDVDRGKDCEITPRSSAL